ncbi:hypothetical protein FJZ53_07410 [Candidatus Woesearchaeota archaeon]|nr:hypothetical protein [Candidatus Woesearchaeota archaeon]
MKVPKTFIQKKGQEFDKKIYIKSKASKSLDILLRSCEKFLEQQRITQGVEEKYNTGFKIAKDDHMWYTKLCYTKKDLQNLVGELTSYEENDRYTGVYVSVLLNNIIQERDVIVLKPKAMLTGLGTGLSKGTLIIKGDVADNTGIYMSGGKIVIEGNARTGTGHCMAFGDIRVRGYAKGWTGYGMRGGRITVSGNDGGFVGSHMQRGEIVIYGDAEECVGEFMSGGSILIKGSATKYSLGHFMMGGIISIELDAGELTGSCMEDGLIIIGRDVGPLVGANSKGGEIRINGKIETTGQRCKAKVYQKGELVQLT